MKRIVILISERGSNMRALVRACADEAWPAQVVGVIGHRPASDGLAFAAAQGLATQCIDHRAFASREAFDEALAEAIDRHAPDLVLLAGFMRILTPGVRGAISHGRMLNIHPSLAAGLHRACTPISRAHRQPAVRWPAPPSTVVTPDLDHGRDRGPGRRCRCMRPDDGEATLAARVLEAELRLIYPLVVHAGGCRGELSIEGASRSSGIAMRACSNALFGPMTGPGPDNGGMQPSRLVRAD